MAGSNLWNEPFNLTLGELPLDHYINDSIQNAPKTWPDKLIVEAAGCLNATVADLTYEQVVDYLTNVKGQSAGPDSLMQIKRSLEYHQLKKKGEA